MSRETANLLEVKNLRVIYKTDQKPVCAVNGISFSVNSGETIGLVGETGAGKTTCALSILRLLPERTGRILEGEIRFKGDDLLKKSEKEMRAIRGGSIAMVFQDPMTSLNPVKLVGNQIMESLEIHNLDRKGKKDLEARVDELLSLVGIPPVRKSEYPHQFSGGMKQRVVIAIALACNPELIIADEPTTALDVTIQAQVLAMINELKEKMGTSMIMITHDLGVVAQTCDKVAVMYAGEIIEQGAAADIFKGENHHPYTVGLFGSIPNLEVETARLSPIEGLMPNPTDLPEGCKFHPRCKHSRKICETTTPAVWEEKGHKICCHLFSQKEFMEEKD